MSRTELYLITILFSLLSLVVGIGIGDLTLSIVSGVILFSALVLFAAALTPRVLFPFLAALFFFGGLVSSEYLLYAVLMIVISFILFLNPEKPSSTNAQSYHPTYSPTSDESSNPPTEKPFHLEYEPLNFDGSPELSNPPPPPPELPVVSPKSPLQLKIEKANEMRNNPTPAEERMWEILNSSVISNFPEHTFYSQSLQYGYILDFYCPTLKLAIEVDGSSHNIKRGYDWERQAHLERKGIQIFRANNTEVFSNPQGLVDSLYKIIKDKNQELDWKRQNSAMRYNKRRYSPRRY